MKNTRESLSNFAFIAFLTVLCSLFLPTVAKAVDQSEQAPSAASAGAERDNPQQATPPASSPRSLESASSSSNETPEVCNPPPPFHGYGLAVIALHIHLDDKYISALDCHGHETECVHTHSSLDAYRSNAEKLKDLYGQYPKALVPGALIEQITPFLDQRVLPRQIPAPGQHCRGAGLIVFSPIPYASRKSEQELKDVLANPASIVYDVGVDIFDDTKPRMAVLSGQIYDHSPQTYHPIFVQPISLDLNKDEMTQTVKTFFDRFVQEK